MYEKDKKISWREKRKERKNSVSVNGRYELRIYVNLLNKTDGDDKVNCKMHE